MELPQSDHELVYRSRQEYERLSKAGSAEAPEACLRRGPRHIKCCCCLSSWAYCLGVLLVVSEPEALLIVVASQLHMCK